MTCRVGTAGRATRKPVVVIAGEDGNDRKSLRILLEGTCPEMRGRLVEIKDSVRLRRASGPTLRDRVSVLYRKARARAEREQADLACLFVHEDWDDVDSDHCEAARRCVQQALDVTLQRSHYILVVWEIEAWLLLFPAAVSAVISSWAVPTRYRGRDTGRLVDPKRILRSECSVGARRYQEADAPTILRRVVEDGHLHAVTGTNRSWSRFQQDVATCCASHLTRRHRA